MQGMNIPMVNMPMEGPLGIELRLMASWNSKMILVRPSVFLYSELEKLSATSINIEFDWNKN